MRGEGRVARNRQRRLCSAVQCIKFERLKLALQHWKGCSHTLFGDLLSRTPKNAFVDDDKQLGHLK